MRTHGSRKQQDAIHRLPGKQMQKVFEVKNCKVYFCVCVCVAFPQSSRSLTEIFASLSGLVCCDTPKPCFIYLLSLETSLITEGMMIKMI